jgi:hypothetical protein
VTIAAASMPAAANPMSFLDLRINAADGRLSPRCHPC